MCAKLIGTIFSTCILLFSLSACTIFDSSDIEGNAPGLIYYLPKSLVTIKIVPWGWPGFKLDKDGNKTKERNFDSDRISHVDLEVVGASNVPDLLRSYVLRYRDNAMTTDHVCAGTEGGLLVAVEAASVDETGNIVVSIAGLVGRLAGATPFAAPAIEAEGEGPDAVKIADRAFEMTVDPLIEDDRRAVEKMIGVRFKELARKGYTLQVDGEDALVDGGNGGRCPEGSVCYRTAVKTQMILKDSANNHTSFGYAQIVNRRVVGHVDVTRAFMVEKITRLTFDEGVLEGVAIKKPSEALAVAKLPLAVVDAVMTSALAAPGQFISNIGGLSAQEQIALIKQVAENSSQIKTLDTNLDALREGDLIPGRFTEGTDKLFTVRCSRSFPSVVAKSG